MFRTPSLKFKDAFFIRMRTSVTQPNSRSRKMVAEAGLEPAVFGL